MNLILIEKKLIMKIIKYLLDNVAKFDEIFVFFENIKSKNNLFDTKIISLFNFFDSNIESNLIATEFSAMIIHHIIKKFVENEKHQCLCLIYDSNDEKQRIKQIKKK